MCWTHSRPSARQNGPTCTHFYSGQKGVNCVCILLPGIKTTLWRKFVPRRRALTERVLPSLKIYNHFFKYWRWWFLKRYSIIWWNLEDICTVITSGMYCKNQHNLHSHFSQNLVFVLKGVCTLLPGTRRVVLMTEAFWSTLAVALLLKGKSKWVHQIGWISNVTRT